MKSNLFNLFSLLAVLTLLLPANGTPVTAQAPLEAQPSFAGRKLEQTVSPDLGVLSHSSSPTAISSLDVDGRVSTALSSSGMFIENVGQFANGARFQVRGGDRTIWLSEDAMWVTVPEQGDKETSGQVDKGVLSIRNSLNP